MKIYIFVDMEGISGISGSDFVTNNGRFYQDGRKYYTMDINACAAGCFKAGAEQVLVRDGHGSGNHAIWEMLDPRVEIIQGRTTTGRRLPDIEGSAGIIFLGYHAMAGSSAALLEHTYSSATVQNVWLNGKAVGELGIDSAIAAEYGVPTIMVSGDDKLCAEASEWVPNAVACQVKSGYTCQGARLLSLERAHQLIESTAIEAVKKIGSIPLPKIHYPVKLRLELVERGINRSGQDISEIDARTIETETDSVEKAFFRIF